jgi:hypothetical protein
VTNFATDEAIKGAMRMFPEDERRMRASVSLLYLDARVDRWFEELIRSFPDLDLTKVMLDDFLKKFTVYQGALVNSHYAYTFFLPSGVLCGRDGKYTTRFLEVVQARFQLAVRTLCGTTTTISKVLPSSFFSRITTGV